MISTWGLKMDGDPTAARTSLKAEGVVRERMVAEAVVKLNYGAVRFKDIADAEAHRPYLYFQGDVVSLSGDFPAGASVIRFTPEHQTRLSLEYRMDDDEIFDLIKRGLYTRDFQVPAQLYTKELLLDVECDVMALLPSEPGDVTVYYVEIERPWGRTASRADFGASIEEAAFEEVPYLAPEPAVEEARVIEDDRHPFMDVPRAYREKAQYPAEGTFEQHLGMGADHLEIRSAEEDDKAAEELEELGRTVDEAADEIESEGEAIGMSDEPLAMAEPEIEPEAEVENEPEAVDLAAIVAVLAASDAGFADYGGMRGYLAVKERELAADPEAFGAQARPVLLAEGNPGYRDALVAELDRVVAEAEAARAGAEAARAERLAAQQAAREAAETAAREAVAAASRPMGAEQAVGTEPVFETEGAEAAQAVEADVIEAVEVADVEEAVEDAAGQEAGAIAEGQGAEGQKKGSSARRRSRNRKKTGKISSAELMEALESGMPKTPEATVRAVAEVVSQGMDK